ncbi:MAG: MATE family efflux transporter, partial [Planctomycetota bacterium]
LMGQYLGAGSVEGARAAVRLCWLWGAGLMSLMGVVFLVFPEWLAWALAPGPEMAEVRAMAVPLLRICGPIQVFFATYLVLSHALRGAGDTRGPMVITYASTFLVRLPAAYVLALPMGFGLTGLWFGLCGELIVRGLLYVRRFRAERWAEIEV